MPLYTPNLYFISDIKYGPTNIFSFSILNLLILILQTTLPFALLRLLIVAFIPNLSPRPPRAVPATQGV
jgi:hypothetical protein